MKKPSDEQAQRICMLEKEADEVRRILIDELNRLMGEFLNDRLGRL